jgi:uncharacterized protein YqjF (DUF2071 family)
VGQHLEGSGAVSGRESAMAKRRPVGRQQWRDLLFVHWEVPEAALRALIPRELALDLFEGRGYVTVIPFRISESRPAGFPRALVTRLLEINVRTYVRAPDGEAGIYFFSLDASSVLAVAAARLLYGLPYYPAAISMARQGPRVLYRSRRRVGGRARLEAAYVPGAARPPVPPATLDHFLIERYSLYVRRGGAMYRTRVCHQPYPLRSVQVDQMDETLLVAAGLPAPGVPACCHFSPGVDVEIYWRERLLPRH